MASLDWQLIEVVYNLRRLKISIRHWLMQLVHNWNQNGKETVSVIEIQEERQKEAAMS